MLYTRARNVHTKGVQVNKESLKAGVNALELQLKTSDQSDPAQLEILWQIFQRHLIDTRALNKIEIEWKKLGITHRGVINTFRSAINAVGMSTFGFYWSSDRSQFEFLAKKYVFHLKKGKIVLVAQDKSEIILHVDGERLDVSKIDP